MRKRGFTLIELMVIVAIIGIFSAAIFATSSRARARSRDARKQADMKSISTALNIFFSIVGRMPDNPTPGTVACEGDADYDTAMQELVTQGVLASIPRSPGGAGYCYYNYGPGGVEGGLFQTVLETVPDSTTGAPGSCRPFAIGANRGFCELASTKQYCICNPH